jgi:hypothetical protein
MDHGLDDELDEETRQRLANFLPRQPQDSSVSESQDDGSENQGRMSRP